MVSRMCLARNSGWGSCYPGKCFSETVVQYGPMVTTAVEGLAIDHIDQMFYMYGLAHVY